MREILKTGKDILSISFSSALSTTYQSSVIAAEELKDEFPDAKILTVDSLCASLGQGLFVSLRAGAEKGKTIDEVKTFAEGDQGPRLPLVHSGRSEPPEAGRPDQRRHRPVRHHAGHQARHACGRRGPPDPGQQGPRPRKASLTALVDRMEATAIDPAGQTVFISHGDCLEDAEFVAGEVRRRLGVETVHINYVGPVIGNHSGPGTMALFFLGSER